MQGYFLDASVNILDYVWLEVAYQDLYCSGCNGSISEPKRNKSFQTNINISTEKIPRLEIAKAFYQRNNDLEIFNFSEPSTSTIYGYELGFKISEGMIMVYRNKITHQEIDGKVVEVPIMQIEAQMKF